MLIEAIEYENLPLVTKYLEKMQEAGPVEITEDMAVAAICSLNTKSLELLHQHMDDPEFWVGEEIWNSVIEVGRTSITEMVFKFSKGRTPARMGDTPFSEYIRCFDDIRDVVDKKKTNDE